MINANSSRSVSPKKAEEVGSKLSSTAQVTERFGSFIEKSDYAGISEKAIENAKLHILDTFGAALAAVPHPIAKIVFDYCKTVAEGPVATAWATNYTPWLPMAAFANGLLAHALDYDDWDAFAHVGHPSCMVVSSALTTTESLEGSGKDFLKGYIVGIEIAAQMAYGCPDIHKRGFHSTPIFGTIGSTAAAASTLALNPEQIKAAFGIAASAAGGLHRQQGSMVKPFHAGNGARNGVEAALLARRGFTADKAIIENPRGFCDTFFGEGRCDYERMLKGLGDPFYLESPGLSFKKHPCSAPQFLAADAVLHLVQRHHIDCDQVRKLELKVSPLRHQRHYRPLVESGLQGKFTINYVTAVALLDGKLELESFSDSKVKDPKVQEAFRKVEVTVDPSIPESGEYCPVTIELNDGKRFSHTATVPKGHAKNPLTRDEVLEKFRSNVKNTFSHDRSERLIASVMELEKLGSVRALTEILKAE